MIFARGLLRCMSPEGTKRTSSDVRSLFAIGDKSDLARKAHFGSDDQKESQPQKI